MTKIPRKNPWDFYLSKSFRPPFEKGGEDDPPFFSILLAKFVLFFFAAVTCKEKSEVGTFSKAYSRRHALFVSNLNFF